MTLAAPQDGPGAPLTADSTLTLIRRIIAAQNATQETTMTIHGNKSFDTVEHSRFELWEIDQMITDLDKAGYAVVSKEGGSVEHLEGLLDEATSANESLRARNGDLEAQLSSAVESNRNARNKIERLEEDQDGLVDANGSLCDQNESLRELSNRLSRLAQDRPVTMDALRTAWEGAEVPTEDNPICKGDEVIKWDRDIASGMFKIWEWGDVAFSPGGTRIRVLPRAPKPREPWQALADVLDEMLWKHDASDSPSLLAEVLHERGVRVVTEGDESNE